MSSTRQDESLHGSSRSSSPIARAWISVALIPAFLLVSVVLTLYLYEWFGYEPENADAPPWVEIVTTAVAIIVFLVPCVAAVLYGRQASRGGDRRGLIPVGLGVLAGLSLSVLSVVSSLGPL